MADLAGRRALLVGGSSGLGLAAARAMRAAGATVTIAGRNPDRATEAARALDCHVVTGDAADPEQSARMVAEAASAMGGLDTLWSSAGGDPMPRLQRDTPLAEVMGDLTGTLAPVILPARAAFDHMAATGGGSLILVASDAGKIPTPGETAIGAAMAAIIQFARGLAVEGKRAGIRANILTPSIVRGTPLYDRLMGDAFAGKLFAKAESMASLGVAEPQDLADLAVFLAGPGARRITGQAISVTGGISAL